MPPSTRGFALSAPEGFSLARHIARVGQVDTMPPSGRVIRSVGLLIESAGPRASVGEICEITGAPGEPPLPVQVVGFRDGTLLTVPLGDTAGVRPGDRIVARAGAVSIGVGPGLLGRVVDALGQPLDGRPLEVDHAYPLFPAPLNPMDRDPVVAPLGTGVRAMD